MKVFMLGWEFPPVISGGLGVACYGLAKALNARGTDILFLLPKPLKKSHHNHHPRQIPAASQDEVVAALDLPEESPASAPESMGSTISGYSSTAPEQFSAPAADSPGIAIPGLAPPVPFAEVASTESPATSRAASDAAATEESQQSPQYADLKRITFVPIDSPLTPYQTPGQYQRMIVEDLAATRWEQRALSAAANQPVSQPPNQPRALGHHAPPYAPPPMTGHPARYLAEHTGAPAAALNGAPHSQYAGDLFAETDRYAQLALSIAKSETFDIVHAHDWMTFEAGAAVAAAAHKPLVVQIHSTEIDRAGVSANCRIMEIERCGMVAATRIIAVSYQTKTQLIEKYGIDPRKIEVVYNAANPETVPESAAPASAIPRKRAAPKKHHTVLFLGRLTEQKGPDLFLQAAKKVHSIEPDVKFVIAGKGEMLDQLKELAESLEIRHNVLFTGFLKKAQADKIFAAANVYVMPSISEPFGIASLDALAHDVPVIISKQSGVAEVLRHVLKVDFWDTEDLANKILAVLRHPPLAQTLREQGQHEARQLSWDDSAARIMELYESLVHPPRQLDPPSAGRSAVPGTAE